MDLSIMYEDEHMVVINKPPGLVVHPAPGNWHGTLVNGLVHHFGESFTAESAGGELEMAGQSVFLQTLTGQSKIKCLAEQKRG